jgi:hypothetical protein
MAGLELVLPQPAAKLDPQKFGLLNSYRVPQKPGNNEEF